MAAPRRIAFFVFPRRRIVWPSSSCVRSAARSSRIGAWVDEGRVVTAGGVPSSLDLGLYLVEKYWGRGARVRIANQMEYRGYSPA
jgi:hypothetical protein